MRSGETKVIHLNHGIGRYIMRGGNRSQSASAVAEDQKCQDGAKQRDASNRLHGLKG